jgi:hypothetical protein
MRITRIVMHSPTSATAYLEPSWWERLWGEKARTCDIERRRDVDEEGALTWRSKHTGEKLGWMRWGSAIQQALEFQPVVDPPTARALPSVSGGFTPEPDGPSSS